MSREIEEFSCSTCGHKWIQGFTGAHNCSVLLLNTIALLERDLGNYKHWLYLSEVKLKGLQWLKAGMRVRAYYKVDNLYGMATVKKKAHHDKELCLDVDGMDELCNIFFCELTEDVE